MRKMFTLGVALMATLPLTVGASLGDTPTQSLREMLKRESLEEGRRMLVVGMPIVRRYQDLDGAVAGPASLSLRPGTEFEVLEVSRDGKVARIGLDSANASMSDLYVNISDLEAATLVNVNDRVEEGDDDVEDSEEIVLDDETLEPVRRRRTGGGMTYCYRDVKKTLLKAKKCNRYASGVRAAEGYKILARECGMKQVGIVSPASLPTYSVCVSSGGRPCGGGTHCGHIAIKLPNGKWFGAGTRGTPYLPNSKKRGYAPRKITGCLVPK